MAAHPLLQGRGIGGRHAAPMPLAEINVTPLVDVMLVLLVIFMITAPLVAAGVQVDLPQVRARQIASDQKQIEIAIDGSGQIYLGEEPVARAQFARVLAAMAQASGDPVTIRVFVRADRTLAYGAVMAVVAEIASAGFTKVAFLSDPRPPAAGAVDGGRGGR